LWLVPGRNEFALFADKSAGLEKIIVCCAGAAKAIAVNAITAASLDGKSFTS
jgi:hypothetical protein